MQGPEFINKAVDLAVRELTSIATAGQGFFLFIFIDPLIVYRKNKAFSIY